MGVLFKRMRAELGVADKKLSAVVEVAEAAPQSAIRQRMNRTTGRNLFVRIGRILFPTVHFHLAGGLKFGPSCRV